MVWRIGVEFSQGCYFLQLILPQFFQCKPQKGNLIESRRLVHNDEVYPRVWRITITSELQLTLVISCVGTLQSFSRHVSSVSGGSASEELSLSVRVSSAGCFAIRVDAVHAG